MKTRAGGVHPVSPPSSPDSGEAPPRHRGEVEREERRQRLRAPATRGRDLSSVRTRAGESVRRQQRAHARGVWLPPLGHAGSVSASTSAGRRYFW